MSHDPMDPVDALVADLLDACRDGRRADCEATLREHPEYAAELSAFVDNYNKVAERFAPLHELSGGTPCSTAEEATIGQDDTAVPPPPKAGSSFGDYDLLSEVARGGMGIVYKARQKSLNRIVALKMVLGSQRDSSIDRDRFLVEARAVARLNHPHIVPIYEVGERDGQPYFTMEFLSGGSLRDQSDRLRGDQRVVARLMVTVARAVEHAHRRGILHRDIKPNNVLLDERGEPHVTDFGLAKQLDEESELTQAGAILGTPSYMAPEQANAETDLTTAVDVYGLGALMYDLLTGKPPFKGSTPMETMLSAISKEPTRPRKLAPVTDADLETICLKCLEKDPLARYSSADALADDLERWLDGKPILARPVTTTEWLVKWSRRQPLLAGSLATVAVAALGLLVLAGFLWQNAEARAQAVKDLGEAKTQLAEVDGQRQQAEAKKSEAENLADEQRKIADQQKALADKVKTEVDRLRQTAEAEKTKAEAARSDAAAAQKQLESARHEARRTIYAADMQLAHAALQGENIAGVNDLLERYLKPSGDDPRGFEWYYLWRRAHGAQLEWNIREQPQPITTLAISPDGKKLAISDGYNRDILLWDAQSGKQLTLLHLDGKANAGNLPVTVGLKFTDDGRKLVAAIYDFDVIREVKEVVAAVVKKESLDLRLLGNHLEIRTWDLTEDRLVQNTPFDLAKAPFALFSQTNPPIRIQHDGEAMAVSSMAISDDGKLAAFVGWPLNYREEKDAVFQLFATSGGRLIIWDIVKARVHAVQNAPTPLSAVTFSPDGRQLAIGNHEGVVSIGTPDADKPPRLFVGHRGNLGALRFSKDGSRLFSGAADGPIIEWDVATGKEIARRRGHASAVSRLEISADGKILISGGDDGSIKVWDLGRIHDPLVLHGHSSQIQSLAFAGDGRELMSVDGSGVLKTWSVGDGKLLGDSQIDAGDKLGPSGNCAIRSNMGDQSFTVRNLTTGKVTQLTWKENFPTALALSRDDRWAATASTVFTTSSGKAGLAVWSVAEGRQVAECPEKGPTHWLSFSTDNTRLIAGHESGAILWDWQANKVQRLEPKGYMNLLAVSKGDKLLAGATLGAVGRQAIVRIWDLKSNELKVEFHGAGGRASHLAFSPDGLRLATVSDTPLRQSVLQLWDTTSGREVFSANLPPVLITAMAFSPDGHRLAAATAAVDISASLTGRQVPSEVHLWDATPVQE